jgi:F-type H+-transporting ATPase subunit gamma
MANTKAIKQKIKATTSIKKITKTMEMVAVSKMKKSVSDVNNLADYIREVKMIINRVKDESKEKHIFFEGNKTKSDTELVVIFASNKGLCGSFNTNIYKKTKKLVEQNPNIKEAICFGKFAEKTARKLGLEIKLSYLDIEKVVRPTQIFKIENAVRTAYTNGNILRVHAVYTNFVKMGVFEPRFVTLYPVDRNLNTLTDEILNEDGNVFTENEEVSNQKATDSRQIYTFEPGIQELIDKTIPKLIKMILYSFILESRASENASRSIAMKRANESAGELLVDLNIRFNKVRQDSITQEIAEISAGANAG